MCGILGLDLSRGQTEPGASRKGMQKEASLYKSYESYRSYRSYVKPLPKLESDLIAAFERQDLTRIGRGRDFKPETLD